MDIEVLGIVLTAVVGVTGMAATHFYHVRGSREQKALLNKLPDAIVAILKEDVREQLSIDELNELIYRKAIDEDAWAKHDPLPYKACPRCGNTDLLRGEVEGHRDHRYYVIECDKCKWSEWTE
jgi:hypothetical protein